jgi:hypothetical protein
MNIIAPGADIDDDSWKTGQMREWEQKWDRKLGPLAKPARAASASGSANARKARRTA